MFHANGINLEKCDYKIILGNSSKMNQSEPSDWSPDFRTTMKMIHETHKKHERKIKIIRVNSCNSWASFF